MEFNTPSVFINGKDLQSFWIAEITKVEEAFALLIKDENKPWITHVVKLFGFLKEAKKKLSPEVYCKSIVELGQLAVQLEGYEAILENEMDKMGELIGEEDVEQIEDDEEEFQQPAKRPRES